MLGKQQNNLPKYYTCIDCRELKEGTATRCRKCNTAYYRANKPSTEDRLRNWNLQKKYGISLQDFEDQWFIQQGKCWICLTQLKRPTKGRGQSLDVVATDHNHKTGKFRALLCNGCNKGLGFFKDDVQLLEKAVRYLKCES